MKTAVVLAIVLLGLVQLAPAQVDQFPIQLYYGALCPDSVRFVQYQLGPLLSDIVDYVDIEYIPFGKATSVQDEIGTVTFQCQQGSAECFASRVQLCALNLLDGNEAAQGYFVVCQMAPNHDPTGETCGTEAGIDFEALDACVRGTDSTALMLEAEERTNLIPLTWVPTVVFNDDFDQYAADRAEINFRAELCDHLNNTIPVCNTL